jgi:pyruvate kinase
VDVLNALVSAGVDVFRLNFSHGNHASHGESFARIREASARAGRQVAIMQDLSGPKIRTGPLAGDQPILLEKGETLILGGGNAPAQMGPPIRVFTPYVELVRSARPGHRLLLDDGRIELEVTGRSAEELVTAVIHGGPLGAHKGINAPGVPLPPSALTRKDVQDLQFGLSLGVDLVALSFVQTAEDVASARAIIDQANRATPIIAKIERPAALQNLDEILRVAQGVMVARGDLGLEMPLEQVPRAQKEIIRRARSAGVPTIVATQVLESMRVEPRPTRAEVSDAANAVEEGTDAIMLAGETAAGAYPVRAVEMLDAVIRDAESIPSPVQVVPSSDPTGSLHSPALARAAVTLATTAHAAAIVAVTNEGKTARLLSALRPEAPILAAAPDGQVAAPLALAWGVVPFVTTERNVERLTDELLERRLVPAGAFVVFISVSADLDRTDANFLQIRHLQG